MGIRIRTNWADRQAAGANVVEDARHQTSGKALAAVHGVGFDVWNGHDVVTEGVVGEADSFAIEMEFVPPVIGTVDDGQVAGFACACGGRVHVTLSRSGRPATIILND